MQGCLLVYHQDSTGSLWSQKVNGTTSNRIANNALNKNDSQLNLHLFFVSNYFLGSTGRLTHELRFSEPCRYEKGPWSECDPKNNMRTRTLTLKDRKKGDTSAAANCEPTKTIQKKCKKGKKGWSLSFTHWCCMVCCLVCPLSI